MAKKKRNWINWLFEIDSNMMNALNLMGLAITTYGVTFILPPNNLKFALGIASFGFIILGFLQLIIFVVNLCGRKKNKKR